ncbi:unnamed protein product, partial [Sphagnum compactum]
MEGFVGPQTQRASCVFFLCLKSGYVVIHFLRPTIPPFCEGSEKNCRQSFSLCGLLGTKNTQCRLHSLLGQLPSLDNCFITQTLNCFIPSLGLGVLFTCILHLRTGHVGLLFTLISQPSACHSFVMYICVYRDSSGACINLLACWIFYRWRHLYLKPFSQTWSFTHLRIPKEM